MEALDNFYMAQAEPIRSSFLALRDIILSVNPSITNEWKYGGSFFCYKGKNLCYIWYHKKFAKPYIGFVQGYRMNHPELLKENRSQIKILLVDPDQDFPVEMIKEILQTAVQIAESSLEGIGQKR